MTGRRRQQKTMIAALMLASSVPAFGQALQVGQPAPDFTVTSVDGETSIRLSDLRGKRVLIFNWATW